MPPRRVTHVITGLETGGAEMMLVKLLRVTDRARWQPSVVSLRDRGDLGDSIAALGIPVTTVRMQGRVPTPAAGFRLRRALRDFAPDLIQGWMYHGNLAATFGAVGRGGLPVVWTIRSLVFNYASERRATGWIASLGALLSRRAARIIYNSPTSAQQHAAFGYAGARALVIPNGFDTDIFAPSAAARTALRRRLGLAEDAILVGRIGRYHQVKDFPGFLAAAAQLSSERPNVRYVLAGPGIDARNFELAHVIERLGLRSVVYLLGEVTPMNGLIAALDINCSSSAYGESFPNILGEALACGVPCVTTDLGDSAWIVGPGGSVVPPRDPAALAAACRELVDAGPEARRRMGLAGRARIEREFSLQLVASQFLAVYDEVISSRRVN